MRKGWTYRKLGDICTSELGKTLNQSKDTGELRPYLCSINVQWDSIDLSTVKQARFEDGDLERYSVSEGDLLVCEGGDIGRAAIWTVSTPMLYQNALHRVRFTDACLPRFYLYYLHFLKNKGTLDAKFGKGVTIKHLVKSSLMSIPVPVPSLSEQERIVAELDLLQGIIDKQKAQLKELDTLAQSIFYDMFGDPTENVKGLEIKEMRELFDIGSSKRVFESQWTDRGVPFYRAREIVRLSKGEPIESPIFISGPLYQDYSTKYGVPSAGDIMVTAVGTLGTTYIVKATDRFYFKDGNILWFKSKGLCESRFIQDEYSTSFVMDQIQGNANAAVVGTYTIMNANKTKVVVPPLSLQKEYVEQVSVIDGQKGKIKQSIAETQKLFDYTMDKYFG